MFLLLKRSEIYPLIMDFPDSFTTGIYPIDINSFRSSFKLLTKILAQAIALFIAWNVRLHKTDLKLGTTELSLQCHSIKSFRLMISSWSWGVNILLLHTFRSGCLANRHNTGIPWPSSRQGCVHLSWLRLLPLENRDFNSIQMHKPEHKLAPNCQIL